MSGSSDGNDQQPPSKTSIADAKQAHVHAQDDVVELAIRLINIESTSGHEQQMATAVKQLLEERGWAVELQAVAPQKSTIGGKIRHNIYAHRPGHVPRAIFNSHIDTVRYVYKKIQGSSRDRGTEGFIF